jgi:hypothetical protein
MKKNKPQETHNQQRHIMISNKVKALRLAETEGNNKHETKDPAPPPIFVQGITDMQQLTARIEQVVNRLIYTLKIINTQQTNLNITNQ